MASNYAPLGDPLHLSFGADSVIILAMCLLCASMYLTYYFNLIILVLGFSFLIVDGWFRASVLLSATPKAKKYMRSLYSGEQSLSQGWR